MPDCDHSPMRTTGDDHETTCPGCGLAIGKFTAPDGRVFTVKLARDTYARPSP